MNDTYYYVSIKTSNVKGKKIGEYSSVTRNRTPMTVLIEDYLDRGINAVILFGTEISKLEHDRAAKAIMRFPRAKQVSVKIGPR